MKTSSILKIVIVLIFCCYSAASAGSRKGESWKEQPNKSQYTKSQRDHKENRRERSDSRMAPRRERSDHRVAPRHDRRHDYRTHRGYRERPHDRGRHYGRYSYRGHDYDYHGHWSSWAQWHDYAQKHPRLREHGHYYREGGHLMFRFLDPISGGYFFFSIGR